MRISPSHSMTVVLAILATGCTKGGTGPVGIESASYAPALNVDLAASTRMPSGIYYRDLTTGTGATLADGMQATVRYTGWFIDGSEFDSNANGGVPFAFTVGRHNVIDGWDLGVVGMKVGGKRMLIIPPDKGYGAAAYGKIPANSILVFTVELLDAR